MKLYVDDMRLAPSGWWRATTVTEAIRILASGRVDEVSLDHDIACRLEIGQEHASEETFEPVARYIALMPERPIVKIHTSNYPAGSRMAEILGIEYRWPSDETPS